MRTLIILTFILAGCSSYKAKKQQIDDKVWQCQELCAGGRVALARIKGLNCMCNSIPQQNVINNILQPPQAIIRQSEPVQHKTEFIYITKEVEKSKDISKKRLTIIKDNATIISNGNKHIISQIK